MESYPFGSGRPDPASFPNRELGEAAMRILPEMGNQLAQYPGSLGYQPLRQLMADRLLKREGMAPPVDEIALTNGSMQGVTLMAQMFITSPGDGVVMEEFSYSGTIGAYKKEGAELVGIPVDEGGMRMDALSDELKRRSARGKLPKFIYVLATFQNPTGAVMPLSRRKELLKIAAAYELPVVEDHCYADTIYEDDYYVPSLYTLPSDVPVVHIESLSKILGPGVRLGCFFTRQPLLGQILSLRRDGGTSTLAAAVVYEYFRENMWTHVDKINAIVKEKRDLMFSLLERFPDAFEWFSRPKGGLFIWVKIPSSTDTLKCEQLADARGIDYATGKAFHVHNADVAYLRLAFGYASLKEIEQGIPKLAECVREAKKAA
ncbi:MAG: PLP-dependent aminotransferase family protein [bacterium]|nr:PLP-dependent aminotransferase family protein [bacterium]